MVEKSVTVQFEMDMETHPIAHLVQEASQYKSSVYLEKDNKKVNAKSIMGMMSLTLEKGSSLKVVADGKDEEKAVKGIENFLTTP
ncbi:HPr family phosphocarrier protein [Faecalicatena contorta]|uniref:HPr family phosphocarrier protein n=1 Tax=Faecalicatena contorta TaxID=39482 RepID=UPI001F25A62C|nr:HPr family phosphocarrier protein [Faecalicatena contorta]MCF2555870.1 HPr family phosphocarrier protein [Faecalicatena contorta]MCF2679825.1 HPr family phosphocarrier protein [Faecalicatena contorta]